MDLASYRVWIFQERLAYYPNRKSASSSVQHALRRARPVDMRCVPREGIQPFTVVRNPFDRLRSLYAANLTYPPLQHNTDIRPGMPWEDFIYAVASTREPYCDNHLWSANHVVPARCEVFYFEDLLPEIDRLNQWAGLQIKLPHIGPARNPKPDYTPELEQAIQIRYHKDLERFYENATNLRDCRARGKAAAQVRQEAANRTE